MIASCSGTLRYLLLDESAFGKHDWASLPWKEFAAQGEECREDCRLEGKMGVCFVLTLWIQARGVVEFPPKFLLDCTARSVLVLRLGNKVKQLKLRSL